VGRPFFLTCGPPNTTKNQQPVRGQVIPYANQRAYTDRLNALLAPAGWTRRCRVHTSANFEPSKDQKIVAKVLVTCEPTIFGLGSHSVTGRIQSQAKNGPTAIMPGTSAEAQAFNGLAPALGSGRYFYKFTGTWVDLDDRKRLKSVPKLAGWATSQEWRRGLRPVMEYDPKSSGQAPQASGGNGPVPHNGNGASAQGGSLVGEIEQMEQTFGSACIAGC
jgi:hypothetical protein